MKIATLNCEGTRHLNELILPWLEREQPDIFCCQEFAEESLEVVARALGAKYHFLPTIKVANPQDYFDNPVGWYGVALFSKIPASVFHDCYYFKTDTVNEPIKKKPNSGWRAFLWMDVPNNHLAPTFSPEKLRLATTHFTWAAGGGINDEQRRDIVSLSQVLDEVQPDVLCGDFNAPRGGEIFSQLAERYRDNIPASVTTTLDQNLHRVPGLQLVVDGMFSQKNLPIRDVRVVDNVSDHCAVIGEL